MTRLILIGVALLTLSACTGSDYDLKSPCVGGENSPCDRRPVNDWWVQA